MEKYLLRGIASAAGATPTEAKQAAAAAASGDLAALPQTERPTTAEATAAVSPDRAPAGPAAAAAAAAAAGTEAAKGSWPGGGSVKGSRSYWLSPRPAGKGFPNSRGSPNGAATVDEKKLMRLQCHQLRNDSHTNERKARWWASRYQKEQTAR